MLEENTCWLCYTSSKCGIMLWNCYCVSSAGPKCSAVHHLHYNSILFCFLTAVCSRVSSTQKARGHEPVSWKNGMSMLDVHSFCCWHLNKLLQANLVCAHSRTCKTHRLRFRTSSVTWCRKCQQSSPCWCANMQQCSWYLKKKKKDDIALQECLHNIDVSFFDTGTWHIQLFLNFDPILLWSLPYVPQNICSRQVCILNTFSLLLCGKNH